MQLDEHHWYRVTAISAGAVNPGMSGLVFPASKIQQTGIYTRKESLTRACANKEALFMLEIYKSSAMLTLTRVYLVGGIYIHE